MNGITLPSASCRIICGLYRSNSSPNAMSTKDGDTVSRAEQDEVGEEITLQECVNMNLLHKHVPHLLRARGQTKAQAQAQAGGLNNNKDMNFRENSANALEFFSTSSRLVVENQKHNNKSAMTKTTRLWVYDDDNDNETVQCCERKSHPRLEDMALKLLCCDKTKRRTKQAGVCFLFAGYYDPFDDHLANCRFSRPRRHYFRLNGGSASAAGIKDGFIAMNTDEKVLESS